MRRSTPKRPINPQPLERQLPPEREPDEPDESPDFQPVDDADDPGDFDEIDLDDPRWEAFLADDDEWDPQPEHGDFWTD